MKTRTTISVAAAVAMALTAASAIAQGRHGQGNGAQDRMHDRAQVERGQRDFDRDRLHDRARLHDRSAAGDPSRSRMQDREQKRIHVPGTGLQAGDPIYGGEMMSMQERERYREQLRLTAKDPQAREKFLLQHREKMQQRAREQGRQLADPPGTGS